MYKRAPGNDDLRQSTHFGLVGILVTTILLLGLAGCGSNFKYTGDHPDKDNYALKISPSAAIVSEGQTLHLTATSPWGNGATWTVLPASLGRFDNQGNFTAGSTLGTGEIVAMWNGDVRYTATASLLVTGSIAVVTNLPIASAAATVNTPATASVPAQAGLTYHWAVPGGTITAGQGTPQIQFTSTVLGSVAITCVLTDTAGDSTTDESTVTVIDVPPAVQYTPAVYSFTRGQLIAPMLPISSGGAPVTWSIAPGLLSGLAFDPQTGQITGTPAILSPPVTYSVTATNSGGSVTTTVAIASTGDTQAIAYNPASYVLTRGNAIQAIVPSITGGTFTSWSISAALPAGLLFDGTTGIVTGTPTVLSSAATYTVTATKPGGAGSTAAVTFSIIDRAPVIHYTPSALSLTKGVSFPPLSPTNTGGAALGWTISPTLPAGLAFDTTTGTLSGAPTGLSASATYTVTASNTGGASNAATVTIVAVDTAPAIVYNPNVFVFIKGTAIPPLVPFDNGGAALSWSIASALPAGLVFDPATGRISGTPTVLSATNNYSVTASDSGGASAASILTLSVVDVAPQISYPAPVYTLSIALPAPVMTPSNTGGSAVSWNISPALPPGLVFAPATGVITGAPTTLLPPTVFSVTATNSGGTSLPFPFTLTVVATAAASIAASNVNPLYGASVVLTSTFTGAVSAKVGTSQGGSDLSASPTSGAAITTAALTSPVTFWLRVTNAAGDFVDSSVTVTPQTVVVGTISPAAATKTFSTATTFSATATGGVTNGITWTASAGTIDAATGIWTAPATAGDVTITATSKDDLSRSANTTVSVVAPATTSITASTDTPLYGATATLTPTFSGAVSSTVGTTQGGSDISASPVSGVAITTAAITSAKTYWLRATNAAGGFVDAYVAVTPQTVVVAAITPAAPARTISTSTTFSTTATGGVTNGITWTASAGTIDANLGVWTAPATVGNVTITATSKDDATKSATTVVNLVAVATSAITASTSTPLRGATVTVTPTFTGAVNAKVGTSQGGSDLSASAVSSAAITTAALTSPVTFWLRVTNAAGDVDSSVTVTPQTVVVGAISPAAPTRTVSSPNILFTATATGGVTNGITWSASGGATINASTGAWIVPATAQSVVITATSNDDATKNSTTTVNVVLPATVSITASTATPLYGATATLTPTFSDAVSSSVGTTQGGSDISSSPVSGVAITTAAITSAKIYWLRATNAAGGFVDASVAVTPQTVVVAAITPAAPARTIFTSTTFSTTASGGVTNGITWTASAGTIDANLGVWTAPATVGNVTITATSKDDATRSATTIVNLVAVATSAITASTSTPLHGATVTVTPTFTGGVSAKVGTSQGISDLSASPVSSAAITTAALTSPVTFWLRVTNAAGDFVDSSVTVTPQIVVVGAISPAAATRTLSTATTFSATATGGVTNGVTWTASAGTIDAATGIWTAPATAGSVTITATSKDDLSRSATTTVSVVAPATASITASTATPLYGATATLTPTFSGAVSSTVGTTQGGSDISTSPVSGVAITTAAITSAKIYWLRATNAAGGFVDASVAVTPQTVVVAAITPAAPARTIFTSTTFSTTASGGVTNGITWTASAGTIDANLGVWTAPATVGNVTITATSKDDAIKSATTVVNLVAVATSAITASTSTPLRGATVTVTPTFTGAVNAKVGTSQGGSDLSASPVNSAAITTAALTSPVTFWLRVTNAAGDFVDSSVTVTPQIVVVGAISPAAPTRTVSSANIQFSATATGGVTNGITWSASGSTTINAVSGVWTVPATPQSVVITATSNDDATKSATTTVTVVAVPTASIVAFTNAPLYGATDTVTPTFSNAVSETVGTTQGGNDVSTAPTSGSAITTAAITTAKTYWLRATNAAGSYADASVTLTPVVAVAAITAGNTYVSVGLTTTLKTTVTGAVDTTVDWTGTGSFSPTNTASAANTTWTAPSTPGVNTLTATSHANATTTRTIAMTVVALPVATSLTASTTSPLYGATITLTPAFTVATGVTASVNNGVGTVTNGTGKASLAITAATTFTLTVTNAALQTATVASALVTPQTVSVGVPSPAGGFVTTSHTQVYTAVVTGASNSAVTWSATGGSFAAATWTAPSTTGSYTITATSVADPTKSNTTTVTVVSPPVITSFTAAPQLAALNFASILTRSSPTVPAPRTSVVPATEARTLPMRRSALRASRPVRSAPPRPIPLRSITRQATSTSAALTVTVVPGSSVTTGSLTGARYNATGTILPGGRVLIAGGRSAVAAPLNTSELYDPVAASFSSAGTMVSARYGQTATLLANNTVLITGGNSGSTTALAELWNSTFASTGALNSPREEHTATLLPSGQVLVVGGLNGSAPVVTAELYNPTTGSSVTRRETSTPPGTAIRRPCWPMEMSSSPAASTAP